eukprot:TRINITY_DN14290_c0_g1_i1.p1 TRINITY_DN14290_c0_g1~~TRINITY_DN14290_c0_g1_i1.p1  ORF type:complete len:288 (+),score=26.39 TRINITY_DN14290_c0_g1_i1:41-904(+)
MRVAFIGGGKVGKAFSLYLQSKGFQITGFYSRTRASQLEAHRLLKLSDSSLSLDQLIIESDFIFITTNDDQISQVVSQIIGLDMELDSKSFFHMSGAHSVDLLRPLTTLNAQIYSLHPLQAFSDIEKAFEQLKDTVFSFEDIYGQGLDDFFKVLGNKHFTIKSEDKSQYHMAACILSNYMVTLLDMGFHVLDGLGIDQTIAKEAFAPLLRGTLENVINQGTKAALTGPIQRGDIDTINGHLENIKDDRIRYFYKYMGRLTSELAGESRSLDVEVEKKFKEVLKTDSL